MGTAQVTFVSEPRGGKGASWNPVVVELFSAFRAGQSGGVMEPFHVGKHKVKYDRDDYNY